MRRGIRVIQQQHTVRYIAVKVKTKHFSTSKPDYSLQHHFGVTTMVTIC